MLRVLGGLAAAVGPLAALVILNSTTSWVSGRVYDQALPIVITWLVVSVIAWLDPGASGRLSGAKGVSDAVSGAIRAAGKTG
jgi:hypothetical protein